jgi:hypothetical protein
VPLSPRPPGEERLSLALGSSGAPLVTVSTKFSTERLNTCPSDSLLGKQKRGMPDARCAVEVVFQILDSRRKRRSSASSGFSSSCASLCASFLVGAFCFFLQSASAVVAFCNFFSSRRRTAVACLQSFWVRLRHDPGSSDSPTLDVGGDDLGFLPAALLEVRSGEASGGRRRRFRKVLGEFNSCSCTQPLNASHLLERRTNGPHQ